MKFLKTIRFDPSDEHVFADAAEPGEWAIPGGFRFAGIPEDEMTKKEKLVFRTAFLSAESFGNSTFTSVTSLSEPERLQLIKTLSEKFISVLAAPSMEEATRAAEIEIDDICELCSEIPVNSVFSVLRHFDDNGEIIESFSLIDPPGEKTHTRIWEIVE